MLFVKEDLDIIIVKACQNETLPRCHGRTHHPLLPLRLHNSSAVQVMLAPCMSYHVLTYTALTYYSICLLALQAVNCLGMGQRHLGSLSFVGILPFRRAEYLLQ